MTRSPIEPPDDDEEVGAAEPGRDTPERAPDIEIDEPDEVPERAQEKGEAGEPPD